MTGILSLITFLPLVGVAAVSAAIGKRFGKLQTGYVYHYAFVMLVGVAGLLGYALYAWS